MIENTLTIPDGTRSANHIRQSNAEYEQSQTQVGPFPIGELNTRFANRANEVYA